MDVFDICTNIPTARMVATMDDGSVPYAAFDEFCSSFYHSILTTVPLPNRSRYCKHPREGEEVRPLRTVVGLTTGP